MIVQVESADGRPWAVYVTTDDGVMHRFVRADDAAARALQAAQDGYERGKSS